MKHKYFANYLDTIIPDSVFVEIGGERGEGSTDFLWKLAKKHATCLFSVDVCDKTFDGHLKEHWKIFYNHIKDDSWPPNATSINQLPAKLQKECIDKFNWLQQVQQVQDYTDKYTSNDLIAVKQIGSEWASSYSTTIGKPISLLYLDNYDYIWEGEQTKESKLIKQLYLEQFNVELNNQDCQLEHYKQLTQLEKNLAPGCLVGLDDTYLYNDCWIGKSGPGVVFLKSIGYQTILHDQKNAFVLMQKPK